MLEAREGPGIILQWVGFLRLSHPCLVSVLFPAPYLLEIKFFTIFFRLVLIVSPFLCFPVLVLGISGMSPRVTSGREMLNVLLLLVCVHCRGGVGLVGVESLQCVWLKTCTLTIILITLLG